jgi:hypothetical protein
MDLASVLGEKLFRTKGLLRWGLVVVVHGPISTAGLGVEW